LNNEKIPSAVIAHNNCPDGAAAVVFCRILHPEISSFFSNHDKINQIAFTAAENLEENGLMYIMDICCDRNILQKIMEILAVKSATLRIYEHHISRAWLKDIKAPSELDVKIGFDTTRCGSKIFFDLYHKSHPQLLPYRDFSNVVNDRDLWLNKDKRGIILTKIHNIYGDRLFTERMLKNSSLNLSAKEEILLEYQDRKEEKHLSFLLETIELKKDPTGYNYGIIYGNGMSSELLDRALQKKGLEYAMLVNLNAKRVSIRSRGNFNCAEFAEKRGGGGHKCAAGFPVEFEFPVI